MANQSEASQEPSQLLLHNLRKRALIIGNNDYKESKQLKKLRLCLNDAELMQKTLFKFGFETVSKNNLTNHQLLEVMKKFGEDLDDDDVDVVVVYYAGHGGQQKNNRDQHFLFGIDVQENDQGIVHGVSLQNKIKKYIQGDRIIIFIMDCCRYDMENVQEFSALSDLQKIQLKIQGKYFVRQNQFQFSTFHTEDVFTCHPGKEVHEDLPKNGYFASAFSQCMKNNRDWDSVINCAMEKVATTTGGRQRIQKIDSKYYNFRLQLRECDEVVLAQLIESGNVSDYSFLLKDKEECSVTIQKPLILRNVNIKSQRCAYLNIIIQGNHQVILENCQFDGIGLQILHQNIQEIQKLYQRNFQNNRNKNTKKTNNNNNYNNNNNNNNSQNFPYANQIQISQTTITNAPKNGLYLGDIHDPCIQNTSILYCKEHGCLFRNCGLQGQMMDCCVQNNKWGISLIGTTINYRDVLVENNEEQGLYKRGGEWLPWVDPLENLENLDIS